eukprot:gene5179-5699_t
MTNRRITSKAIPSLMKERSRSFWNRRSYLCMGFVCLVVILMLVGNHLVVNHALGQWLTNEKIVVVDSRLASSRAATTALLRSVPPKVDEQQISEVFKSEGDIPSKSIEGNIIETETSRKNAMNAQQEIPSPIIEKEKRVTYSYSITQWSDQGIMKISTRQYQSRDLILGLAFNIDEKHLAIFAASLHSVSPNITVILFFNSQPTGRILSIIKEYNLHIICVDVNQLLPIVLRRYHPSTVRYILYDRLLHAWRLSDDEVWVSSDNTVEQLLYHEDRTDKDIADVLKREGKGNSLFSRFSRLGKACDEWSLKQSRLSIEKCVPRIKDFFHRIAVVDVRDTAFQAPPFASLPSLPLPLPDRPLMDTLLTHCGWNSKWISSCFGDKVLDVVSQMPVLCSGVVRGYLPGMIRYLHLMAGILRGDGPDVLKAYLSTAERLYKVSTSQQWISDFGGESRNRYQGTLPNLPTFSNYEKAIEVLSRDLSFPSCERNGVDQGVHNVLIYFHLSPARIIFPPDSAVIHLQAVLELYPPVFSLQRKTVLTSKNKEQEGTVVVASHNNQMFSIVHQYDRLRKYQSALLPQYVSWVNFSNPWDEWKTEPECSSFQYITNIDLLRGKCDISNQRAISLASCCALCNAITSRVNNGGQKSSPYQIDNKACSGFTFVGSVCYFKRCSSHDVHAAVQKARQAGGPPSHMIEQGAVSVYWKL